VIISPERRQELHALLQEMASHPSRDNSDARDRAWVLSQMLRSNPTGPARDHISR